MQGVVAVTVRAGGIGEGEGERGSMQGEIKLDAQRAKLSARH